ACRATFPDMEAAEAVTYVPLFRTRQRERGYNQAALLAGGLAKAMGKPLLRNVLRRLRNTGTQTHLTAGARVTNVHLAFGVRRPDAVRRQRLLLVDDVMTPGATVSECARILKKAGAAQVCVLTVARG
ncbi:MAG: phosphoribosyltransferase family protein, partial [Kiritimatiellaeota bacterium]|nr:phosphoribosyltransferase family protein [Kiritimatiellota bacterium]